MNTRFASLPRLDMATFTSMFRAIEWERSVRLGSGIVLMAFVTTHLINHAVGIFGLAAMEVMQEWRWALWKSPVGSWLLYGSLLVHVISTLLRLVRRRSIRMPMKELLQVVLGLTIPLLLMSHIAETKLVGDESYGPILRHMWTGSAGQQTLLVLVVWAHGIIGLHFVLQAKKLITPYTATLLGVVAILIPAFALAGFVAASREAHTRGPVEPLHPHSIEMHDMAIRAGRYGSLALLLLVAGSMGAREFVRLRQRHFMVQYLGHGAVTVRPGPTLLEISRDNRIPHPSICGGRGRCATCRVLVTKGVDMLPPMALAERALLELISAPPGVRLACQLRPTHDLFAQILLPAEGDKTGVTQSEHSGWGLTQKVTILVVDLRAFTSLVNTQVPYELVVLLNRFQEEMSQAVRAHGGRVDVILVDGLTAIFQHDHHNDFGSKDALRAARDMFRAVDALNEEFQGALPLPLRVGIGIHTGSTLTARIAAAQGETMVVAIGEAVTVANRLEAVTKDMLVDLVLSKEAVDAAGLSSLQTRFRELYVSGREAPVIAYPIMDLSEIDAVR